MRPRLRSAAAAALLAATLAAGATTLGAGGAASSSVPDDVADAAPAGTGIDTIEVSETGRVHKEIGEPAGLVAPGGRTAAFEITVEAVTVTRACPGRGVSVMPSRGYFVVVDVAATMAADVTGDGATPLMPLVADAFAVLGPDGAPLAGPTEASWSCFEDVDLAPPFVGPGESARGKVVLDSAVGHGTLVYAPGGSPGWEWGFDG